MPVTTKQDKSIWKNPLLWLTIGVILLVAGRLLPLATDDPRDTTSVDKTFHIGLIELPRAWRAEWVDGTESGRRLTLDSQDGYAQLLVYAFKGDLDHGKFAEIGQLLFGPEFPEPRQTHDTPAYGGSVTRSVYREPARTDRPMIDTTIDVLWREGPMNQDFAYVVVARSVSDAGIDFEILRAALQFTPPRLTGKGHLSRWATKGFDFVETGEGFFGLLTWCAATIWGLGYLWRQLSRRSRLSQLLIVALLVGLIVLAQEYFQWSLLQTALASTMGVVVSGFVAALLTGAWRVGED